MSKNIRNLNKIQREEFMNLSSFEFLKVIFNIFYLKPAT